MTSSKYVNLHQHSENSTLDGYAKVDEIVKYAKLIGSPAAALTDHGECSGHLQLMKASKEHDLPVVYGQEGYWVWDIDAFRLATKPGSDPVYPGSVIGEKATNSHICLLAETNEGLSNLWAWSSMAYEPKNHHHKPLADPAMMREYAKGLWASDGCMLTEFGHAVEMGDHARAREIFAFLLNIFGDRFYSELHTWRILEPGDDEKAVRMNELMRNINQAKISLANEMGVPLVVVNDAHYTQEDDWEYHRLVWKFNTHGDTDQTDSHKHAADWLMNDAEIYHHMAAHGVSADVVSQAIDNSYNIAMSCQQVEITPTMTMPRLTATDHDDMNMFMDAVQQGYMRKVVDAGLDENLYFPRMESECRLIVNKGFSGYFNITRDMVLSFRDGSYIQWVKGGADKDPRLTGPGRGSAGGSLVSYLLDITSLDPIKYGLLFERFLTEDREDWPDIDTDVPQSARPDAKSFIHARHDHTCAIGTRSRSKAAQTLKDLREPLNIDWGDITEIGKLLKTLENVVETTGDEEMDAAAVDNLTWGEIVELKGGELITWQKKHPKLFDYMERMVGLTRQTSVHAAGVLIGNNSFLGRIPTRIKNDTRTTQFDMHEVEALGAVKMDVLGIRHLDTLEQCRELVYERHGIWLDYDSSGFGQPPEATRVVRFGDEQYNDPKIWEPIARGETLGLFQLETSNGTQAAIDFRPRSEREVCDLISVNRPGVINAGQLPHYMARREGSEAVTYDHPLMEAVTGPGWASDTYGILVYQEQLMRAAEVLAGFTPAERERLRKIIGKKKMDQMIAMEGDFIARCLANPEFMKPYLGGKSPQDRARTTAEKIWRSLLASGAYAFNRSHGMGYGLVTTWEVWDRYYFFPEFITALLRTDPKKTTRYIRTARRRGIEVLPPDVNHSQAKFTLVGDDIRYGLQAIAKVGPAAVADITAGQPYSSFPDFLARSKADKAVVINLILIGALDEFGPRPALLRYYERHRIMAGKKGASVVVGGKRVPKDKLTEAEIDVIVQEALDTPKMNRQKEVVGPSPWIIEVPDFTDEKVVMKIEAELVGNYVTIDPMYKYIEMIEAHCVARTADVMAKEKGATFAIGGTLTKVYEHTIKQGKNKGNKMAFLGVTWNDEEFDITLFSEGWAQWKSYLHLGAPVVVNCIRDAKTCHMTSVIRLDWAITEADERTTA